MRALVLCFIPLLAPGLAGAVPQEEELTFQDIKTLLETQTDEKEILRLVEAAATIRVSADQFEKLRTAGASEKLIKLLSSRIEGNIVDRVLGMLSRGDTEEKVLESILSTGTRTPLRAPDKLRLSRAGAGPSVIRALEGTYVYPDFRSWRDPLGMLSIQLPEGWHTYHWYTDEGVKILLSPEATVPGPNEFKTGLQIQLSFIGRDSPQKRPGFDLMGYFKDTLPSLVRLNRKYELVPIGEPRRVPVAGTEGVEQRFSVTMLKVPCLDTMVLTNVEDLSYFVECVAPKDRYGEYEKTFRRMLSTLVPFTSAARTARRRTALRPEEALDHYRESVVMVKSAFDKGVGFGSGFFVREDGYVLTNHHVICMQSDHSGCVNPANWVLPRRITLVWDAKVESGREGQAHREVPATIDDTVYSLTPMVDAALLKVPVERTPYATIPLSPVDGPLVKEGDPVVAIGFPQPGRMGEGNLFQTVGAISRINYIERRFGTEGRKRDINDLYTDAKIHGGNSGGPCVDLITGAVIGLNTYVPLNLEGRELVFSGVMAIDHALEQFPQVRWYARTGRMGPQEHLELGAMLLSRGNLRSAERELVMALKEKDQLNADQRGRLFHQMYVLGARTGDSSRAGTWLEQSLKENPRYAPALRDTAYLEASRRRLDRALPLIDKIVEGSADDWSPYYFRADMYRLAGDLEAALKALKDADERGGGYDPSLHCLRASILEATGDIDKAMEAYRRGCEVDRADPESRLGLVRLQAQKNPQAALLEWGRILKDFPSEPSVRERYGRHLLSQEDRFEEAVKTLVEAAAMSIERDGRAPRALLADVGRLTISKKGYEPVGLMMVLALHRDWPRDAGAHTMLAQFWSARQRSALAAAHQIRADQLAGRPPGRFPELMAAEDVAAMAEAGYGAALFDEVLNTSGLGWNLSRANLDSLRDRAMQVALVRRYLADQIQGSSAFTDKVEVKFASKVDLGDPRAPRATLEIVNNSPVPLTGLRLQKTYQDKDKKTLWSSEGNLVTGDPVLMPGAKRTLRFSFNTWEAIEGQGVSRDKITWYSVTTVTARNAMYLLQTEVKGAVTPDGKVYRFAITNGSNFRLRKVTLRCAYVTKDGKPLTTAQGQPVSDQKSWTVDLLPGQSTDPVDVAEWASLPYARSLGLPEGSGPAYPQAIVVDAEIDWK